MDQTRRTRRADAERNREAILDAATRRLARDPGASMSEIAAEAGVGRVTMYGHFSSRAELVDAVFARTMDRAEETLARLDLSGDPSTALERLVAESWHIVGESRLLLQAVEDELGPDAVRRRHEEPLGGVGGLINRGRQEGAFRRDLPEAWMVACFYAVLHTAAEEVRCGRLPAEEADGVVWSTIASLLRPR
jgi:AcrR family transcriptional regulator